MKKLLGLFIWVASSAHAASIPRAEVKLYENGDVPTDGCDRHIRFVIDDTKLLGTIVVMESLAVGDCGKLYLPRNTRVVSDLKEVKSSSCRVYKGSYHDQYGFYKMTITDSRAGCGDRVLRPDFQVTLKSPTLNRVENHSTPLP